MHTVSRRTWKLLTGTCDDLTGLLYSECHTAATVGIYCCSAEGLLVKLFLVAILKQWSFVRRVILLWR
jgi:hypothetical protein